jgi:hypothetical protein
MSSTRRKAWVGTAGLLFGPFLFFSLWLFPTKCGVRFGLEGLCYPFLFMSVMMGLGFLWYLPIPLIAKFCVSPFYGFFLACALFTFWYCAGEDVFGMRMSELPPNKRAAGKGGIASPLTIERARPALPEHER